MLDRIEIRGLFNLYNYDIDLKDGFGGKVHFLTAPNGYGKTTVLDMVFNALRGSFTELMTVPFNSLSLFLDDNLLSIVRSEHYPEINEDTDEEIKPDISLQITLLDKGTQVETLAMSSKSVSSFNSDFGPDFSTGPRSANIDLFLQSISYRYIKDDRILEKKTDTGVTSVQMGRSDLMNYALRVKLILNDPIEVQKYGERLSLFQTVVNGLGLSNKIMELHAAFGFRFISTDRNKAIIPLEKLSSGEKHIIIQLCEILFYAQEGTIILIDEPELSLHMAWQYQYLPVIKKIVALCGFQFLIATHSPQIFNAEWSLTTDLFTASVKSE